MKWVYFFISMFNVAMAMIQGVLMYVQPRPDHLMFMALNSVCAIVMFNMFIKVHNDRWG